MKTVLLIAAVSLLASGCARRHQAQTPVVQPDPGTFQPLDPGRVPRVEEVDAHLKEKSSALKIQQSLLERLMARLKGTATGPSVEELEREIQQRKERIEYLKGEIAALLRQRAISLEHYRQKEARP